MDCKSKMPEKFCDADTKELFDAVEKDVYSYEITDFNTAKKRKYPFDYLHTKNIVINGITNYKNYQEAEEGLRNQVIMRLYSKYGCYKLTEMYLSNPKK